MRDTILAHRSLALSQNHTNTHISVSVCSLLCLSDEAFWSRETLHQIPTRRRRRREFSLPRLLLLCALASLHPSLSSFSSSSHLSLSLSLSLSLPLQHAYLLIHIHKRSQEARFVDFNRRRLAANVPSQLTSENSPPASACAAL